MAEKVALVTGASKGVGKGISLELAQRGWDIWVNYHSDQAGAEATAREVEALGRKAWLVRASVGDSAQVDAMFAQIGSLDLLVNNAGVQTWKPLLELTEAEWDHVIDTNLKGCFLCTQRAARKMIGKGGNIINIGSGCNKLAFPRLVDYTASKGGIEQFTKVSAVELGEYNIRVNCVAPGAVEIERTKLEAPDYAGMWSKYTPLARVGTPADIGKTVAFLASDDASFVTGQTIWVDGGLFAKPHWPYYDR
jgi:NAD(P)-dependent dehydrogenase (short-subunit alcohol dehydrogenase family)